MSEQCQKCKELGEDRRTLWMACFYEMMETGLPFLKERIVVIDNTNPPEAEVLGYRDRLFYTLRVCKGCRADWMQSIKDWFYEEKPSESIPVGSGIFIRELGKCKEITREEWDEMQKNKSNDML